MTMTVDKYEPPSMTISESLRSARLMCDELGHELVCLPPKAWDVIRSRLEEDHADLATVYALGKYDGKRIEVSDEMVERALNAYVMSPPHGCDVEVVPSRVKAALVAALGE